jgi:hypothetical protein
MKTIRTILLLALALTTLTAAAQTNKNIPDATDYAAFSKFVSERNVFDPTRQPHYTSTRTRTTRPRTRTTSSAPAFTLVGTMSYEKGVFAFFNGNNSDLRVALELKGTIAGYTVTEILASRVVLEIADKKEKLELKVGDVMREENGKWELSGNGEMPSGSSSATPTTGSSGSDNATATEAEATPSAPSSSSAPNDILKRLMELRAKENQ